MDVVLSGMRRDATILVWVDVRRSAEGGVKWWRSANGVVLTEGLDRKLGLEWVAWVEKRGTGDILFGTKPPGGAAAFGIETGDEEGKAIAKGDDKADNAFAGDLETLKVNDGLNGIRPTGGEEGRAELKDNWDD